MRKQDRQYENGQFGQEELHRAPVTEAKGMLPVLIIVSRTAPTGGV